MMRGMKANRLEFLRKRYCANTRVELVYMDDKYAPPIGTKGTVFGVDDIGDIMVNWDNGSKLKVIYGVDEIKIINDEQGRK